MKVKLTQRESLGLTLAALAIAAVLCVMIFLRKSESPAAAAPNPVETGFDSVAVQPARAKTEPMVKKSKTKPKQRNHLNEPF